jgi:lipoate-protein ligase B
MEIFNLGTIEFDEAYAFQRKILEETCAGLRAVSAIFCRHLPVFTLGRQASFNNIQASINELLEKKIKLRAIGRGGDVTYHGPGQLTVYPVVDLRFFRKDIHWYLRQLEELVLHTLTELGVQACRKKDLTGVWVKEKKICSIGIGIKN